MNETPSAETTPLPAVPATSGIPPIAPPEPAETRFLKWIVFGNQGLRVGWSVGLFLVIALLLSGVLGAVAFLAIMPALHIQQNEFTPVAAVVQESVQFLPILVAAFVCALLERRRILDYNLRGRHGLFHCLIGLVAGAAALSALVGALYGGGWLHFGPIALTGRQALLNGAIWAFAFLLTGFAEEGATRCYMLFTLTRGVNYWWALGSVATFSLVCLLGGNGGVAYGVYLMAALGVLPCLVLHLKKSPAAGFWQAAWLTSTFFGFIHTPNKGESWIGIFSAAFIGFAFCVSVRVTGSAWWAIGFHASWDWAQTFLFGTADSGFVAKGHYLATVPAGPVLWSGGTDGPEGSLLVIPTVLLVILALVLVYGLRKPSVAASGAPAAS